MAIVITWPGLTNPQSAVRHSGLFLSVQIPVQTSLPTSPTAQRRTWPYGASSPPSPTANKPPPSSPPPPPPKTLVRLARCQLSTGSTAPALSTLRTVLALEPASTGALQLQKKVLELEAHLRNLEGARGRREWGMARIALDKCCQTIDGEGGDVPIQWRLWRVELELARGNWDAAGTAAKCVLAISLHFSFSSLSALYFLPDVRFRVWRESNMTIDPTAMRCG